MAQIFNRGLHVLIFVLTEAGLLEQRVVILALLATGVGGTCPVTPLSIVRVVRVAVIAVAGGISRPTMRRVIVIIVGHGC